MARYIDADALLRDIDELKESAWYKGTVGHWARVDAVAIIEDLWIRRAPTADIAPMRHARWSDNGSLSCRCSECGCKNNRETLFCPNCGAKMDGGADE